MDERRGATIAGAVEAQARRAPDRPALIDGDAGRSYAEVARAVRGLAAQFARAGIAPGDTIGIALPGEGEHLLAAVALLGLGCRQVALPLRDAPEYRAGLASRLCVVAVVGAGPTAIVPGASLVVPDLDAALHDGASPAPAWRRGEVVVGTSGTTGRPKLMAVAEDLLVSHAPTLAAHGTVFNRQVPVEGNFGKRLSLRSLVSGGTEVLGGGGPDALAALCARHGVTRVHMAPHTAETLLAAAPRIGGTWPATARILTTGARVPQALRLGLQASLGCEVYVQYGSTEAGMVTIAGPAEHAAHPDTVGHPVAGVSIAVVDEAGLELPAGEEGLIRVRSPGAISAYLDDPEATARHVFDGWYQPGDIGRIAPSGALLVAGRRDDMMSLGTIKIFPGEIEATAEGFPGVRDCAAFAVRSGTLGDIPMLAVVAEPGFDAAALLAHCRARLGLRAPRKVVPVAAVPRNRMGKVLRQELAEQARAVAS